jgi:predicted amidohydrolase
MKMAALQMVSGTDLSANLATARRLLEQAAHWERSWPCCPSISA